MYENVPIQRFGIIPTIINNFHIIANNGNNAKNSYIHKINYYFATEVAPQSIQFSHRNTDNQQKAY